MKINETIKKLVKEEIRRAVVELNNKYGINNLHGFALGTDDDVRTLYHVVCTYEWVEKQKVEQEYDGIGYIFVEWSESGNDNLFLSISNLLNEEADKESFSWARNRDKRFQVICEALTEIREENIFNLKTFLYAGSTDPSDHMEELSLKWIKNINTKTNFDNYSAAMAY